MKKYNSDSGDLMASKQVMRLSGLTNNQGDNEQMKKYNSTNFRRNMNKVLNECEKSSEPVLITTRKDGRDEPQQMVIITKELFDQSNLDEVLMVNK